MEYHKPPFTLREFKIEVTYRCDLNCVHCSSDARPSNSQEMQGSDCLRILREAARMGAKEVAFSGGEPLLWASLSEAVEAAIAQNLKVTIYTSGNADDFEEKVSGLRRLGVSRLIFSLFGGAAVSHERITRKAGSFQQTQAAVRVARSAGFETELHFVPMSTNYRELGEVADLARSLGASRVSVLRLVPQGRASLIRHRALTRVQNLDLRSRILELRDAGFDIRTGSPYNFMMLNEKPGCFAAIDRVIIGPDLQVYPCDAFKRIGAKDLVGSDLLSNLKAASLPACWERSPYLNAVRNYLTTDFVHPCDACNHLEACLSGCLAQKAIRNGSLAKGPDPECVGSAVPGGAR
jgi:radical SAM protein with 4Fe4S-binding SPASM domain